MRNSLISPLKDVIGVPSAGRKENTALAPFVPENMFLHHTDGLAMLAGPKERHHAPVVPCDTEVARSGCRRAISVVFEREGAGVEVGEPNHDLVRVRASRRVGREEVVRDVGDDRAGAALRPCPD